MTQTEATMNQIVWNSLRAAISGRGSLEDVSESIVCVLWRDQQ